jgi:hypothetical protein
MFTRGTVLALKEPKSTEDTVFPYDKVRVIGESPVTRSNVTGEWEGADARGVIIEPLTQFEMNLDEPYGRLRRLYNVESEPAPVDQNIRVEVIKAHTRQAGLTPEEQFDAQRESGPVPPKSAAEAQRAAQTPDPLAALDVNDPAKADKSPLDSVDRERSRVSKRAAKSA